MKALRLSLTAGVLAAAVAGAASAATPPILYVQGLQCPAHVTCTHRPAYNDRIRRIVRVGFPSSRLSSGTFSDSHPVWSPDHRRIVFARESPSGLSSTLWTMNANGNGQRAITHGIVLDTEPGWSPDGRRIVFRALSPDRRAFDLYIVGSGGGRVTDITRNPDGTGALDPDWSPNGRLIVFQRMKQNSGAGTGIFTIRPNGTGLKRLSIGGQDPAWSPDGTRIAVVRPDPASGGQFQIYVMRSNGTGRTRLTSGQESVAPAWSPGGTSIVFVRGSQIALVPSRGGRIKQLTRRLPGTQFVDTPDW